MNETKPRYEGGWGAINQAKIVIGQIKREIEKRSGVLVRREPFSCFTAMNRGRAEGGKRRSPFNYPVEFPSSLPTNNVYVYTRFNSDVNEPLERTRAVTLSILYRQLIRA